MNIRHIGLTAATCALSGVAAAIVVAPSATADPDVPPPPPPLIDVAPPPPLVQENPIQSASGTVVTPPDGVPHLSSPENPPPGTSDVPVGPPQGRGLSYLRDLWHAMRTQNVSGGDALLLLTQRPMNPDAVPPPGLPAGPMPPAPPPGLPAGPMPPAPPAPPAEVPPLP